MKNEQSMLKSFNEFYFQSEQMGDGNFTFYYNLRKDNRFQVKLIELVDLSELRNSYFQYLFSPIILSFYYSLLFPLTLSLSHRKFL